MKSLFKNMSFANSLLILLGLFTALLGAEIFCRFFPISNDFYYQKMKWDHLTAPGMVKLYNDLFVYDSVLGYEKKDVARQIAAIRKRDPSSFKILVLGDSVSQWGRYVEYFSELLVAKYGAKVKVVNAGVMGYDTEMEYRYLKHRGMDLSPDMVILQFCANDFGGTPVIVRQADGSWFALSGDKQLARWIHPSLFRISKIYEAVVLRCLYFFYSKKGTDAIVRAPLEKIKKILEAEKIPFYILVVPFLAEGKFADLTHNQIQKILRELGLENQTIDLLPAFSQVSFKAIRRDSTHPNEKGDQIAAGVLFERLQPFFSKQFEKNNGLAK
jgi:lysophospholipase L1-like esterase